MGRAPRIPLFPAVGLIPPRCGLRRLFWLAGDGHRLQSCAVAGLPIGDHQYRLFYFTWICDLYTFSRLLTLRGVFVVVLSFCATLCFS